jgi:hypothetical protein
MESTGQNGAAINGSQKYSKYFKHFASQTFFDGTATKQLNALGKFRVTGKHSKELD